MADYEVEMSDKQAKTLLIYARRSALMAGSALAILVGIAIATVSRNPKAFMVGPAIIIPLMCYLFRNPNRTHDRR